ncbi:MAG TPA: hypothetical protein VJJ80_02330 [Patescibacteria group bacterium]|nr:hypothetical protein [Patescibacteria group bacterium]
MRKSLLSIAIFLFFLRVGFAQIGPEAPILGKSVLGLNGIAVLEVASPSEYSYNPAAVPLALKIFNEEKYAEIDYGLINFAKGPTVENTWQYCSFRTSQDSAMRVARYTIKSNSKPIIYLGPDLLVKFEGETYEVTYGKMFSEKVGFGVAVVPYENIKTKLSADNIQLGVGEAKSDLHFRVGGIYLIQSNLSVGVVFTKDKINASTLLSPLLSGSSEPINLNADYNEKLWTVGVAWQPKQGTGLYSTWQKGDITGPNLHEDIDLKAFGLQQFLSPKLCIRVGLYDTVPGYQVTYYGDKWNIGVSFSNNTYRRSEAFLGSADTFYIWAGGSF